MFICIVPTPPHNVAVVLIAPDTILVTWTRPSVPSGRIVYYTVYATPFIGETIFIPRTKRQVESFQTIAKVRNLECDIYTELHILL